MEVIKKYKTQIYFHLLLNLVFTIFVSFASFIHIPLHDFTDHFLYSGQFLLVQFSVFGYLYFLSINRLLFTVIFPIFFTFFSIASYWVYFYDIAISQNMIQVALETKPDIIFDLISVPFALYFLATLVFALWIVYYRLKITTNQLRSPLLILATIAVLTYPIAETFKLGLLSRRLPFNVVASTKEYFSQDKLVLKGITNNLTAANDSLNIVFILGESVRADHMQLNGYHQPTNPLLSSRKNLISFKNAYTPNTFTAISVPQIYTDAALGENSHRSKYSLIDVLNHAKIETKWIGNQTPEKSYEIFIKQCKTKMIIDPLHSELSFQKDYDQQLLPVFKKVFNTSKNQFTTLHMMGSHWWYETRYPDSFRIFKPVIKSKHVPSNSPEELINSYDNTIRYLDYFINETIKIVEKENPNALVIYLSDHGEQLGEHGLWLHAQSAKESMNPALLFWYSDKFYKKYPTLVSKLKANQSKKIDLDFFFQTILDLYKVEGLPYKKNKLIYQ